MLGCVFFAVYMARSMFAIILSLVYEWITISIGYIYIAENLCAHSDRSLPIVGLGGWENKSGLLEYRINGGKYTNSTKCRENKTGAFCDGIGNDPSIVLVGFFLL